MAITRMFEFKEWEVTGVDGLKAMWMENADPTSAFGATHDILEHLVDNMGGAEGECMALGAMLWGRGDAGSLDNFSRSLAEILAGDLMQIILRITDGDETMKSPGHATRPVDSHFDNAMISGIVKAQILAMREREYTEAEFDRLTEGFDLSVRMLSWLRKGYRKAQAIYEGKYNLRSYDLDYFFTTVQREIERKMKHMNAGDRLKVRLDIAKTQVQVTHLVEVDWNVWEAYL